MAVKSLPWFYLRPLPTPTHEALLDGEEWHHAAHVMRLKPGAEVILFDGLGHCVSARLKDAAKSHGKFDILADCSSHFDTPDEIKITLVVAPTKNQDRTAFAVEKMTELGVHTIAFADCQHSERTQLRTERLQKVVINAAKQSRKLFLPVLNDMIPFSACIQQLTASDPNAARICCHLESDTTHLSQNYLQPKSVICCIGPEGGFADSEIEEMRSLGFRMITLGAHRLRVETAAITVCAQIHFLHDMKHL